MEATVSLPPKLVPVFSPARGDLRYRGAYGGRGSAKSFSFAKMAAIWGYVDPLRILCTRDIQESIKESFHAELKNAIASEPWLAAAYDVGIDYIRGKNGTECIFKGLRHNISSIKSMAQIDLCIVEEAEDVPEHSWEALEPTIRAPKSEIWVIWNPKRDGSPVDKRFIKTPPPRSMIVEMNYRDNPWFPQELDEQRKHALNTMDKGRYAWIWEGQYLKDSESRVFRNWRVEEFTTPPDATHRLGADWGFSVDPTVLVRCHIVGQKLYVDYEAYSVGCEITMIPELFRTVPEAERWPMTADSARPETISHLRKHGFPKIMPAVKGARSLEEGVEWLQSFEIIVHPRCEHTIDELIKYSYKVDPDTRDVLPVLADKDNHIIDALRYACEGVRRAHAAGEIKPRANPIPSASNWKDRR
jgi:phage terminase large subunit